MLNRPTNTNTAPAEAAILPGVPPHLRAQLAREQARLLEHGCYTEKAEAADPVKSHYHPENERKLLPLGCPGCLRLAENGREQPSNRSLVAAS